MYGSQILDVVVWYVGADDSYALCCLFLHTDLKLAHLNSSTTDAKINKHSLMNGKIQIQWQSAKSNQEETASHVSVCRLQQTLLMRIFFSFHRMTSNSFCPIFLWSRVHASIAKALSGLGLIPIPKCFTANVITSS